MPARMMTFLRRHLASRGHQRQSLYDSYRAQLPILSEHKAGPDHS